MSQRGTLSTWVLGHDAEAGRGRAGRTGSRDVAGMRFDVTAVRPVADQDLRVELVFSENGQPVRDPAGLGMGGHLMVMGPTSNADGPDPTDSATSFAHLHDMDPPVQYGYGPSIGFSYAFPAAGRYQLQVQRKRQLVTSRSRSTWRRPRQPDPDAAR